MAVPLERRRRLEDDIVLSLLEHTTQQNGGGVLGYIIYNNNLVSCTVKLRNSCFTLDARARLRWFLIIL